MHVATVSQSVSLNWHHACSHCIAKCVLVLLAYSINERTAIKRLLMLLYSD
jgi:hypothetical protein